MTHPSLAALAPVFVEAKMVSANGGLDSALATLATLSPAARDAVYAMIVGAFLTGREDAAKAAR